MCPGMPNSSNSKNWKWCEFHWGFWLILISTVPNSNLFGNIDWPDWDNFRDKSKIWATDCDDTSHGSKPASSADSVRFFVIDIFHFFSKLFRESGNRSDPRENRASRCKFVHTSLWSWSNCNSDCFGYFTKNAPTLYANGFHHTARKWQYKCGDRFV